MKYKQEIHEYIESHKDEITEILKEIIKIPSVRGEAELGAPFGKVAELPVRESIGRFKYIEEEKIDAAYEDLLETMRNDLQELVSEEERDDD